MVFVIAKKQYEINGDVPYSAVRRILDAAKHLAGENIDVGAAHDSTFEAVLALLPQGTFGSLDDLKNKTSWKEYKAIDQQLHDLIVGDEKNV